VIALVAVSFEGTILHFQLPLLVDEDGIGRDATEDPDRLKLLGELMVHGDSVKGTHGVFHFGGPGLDPLADPPGSRSVRVMAAEQSNTSIVLDEHIVVKLFRRLEKGPNPDLELNRLLTSEGFDHVPAQVGEITYEGTIDGDDVQIDLAIAQQFLSDGVDGWEHILEQVKKLYDEVDPADAPEDHRFLTEERAADLLASLTELGDVIASMHVTLARDEAMPDLMPEPMEADDAADLVARITASVAASDEVSDLRVRIVGRLGALDDLDDLGAKTRVHGDLHLGQVMLTPRGWMVLDFEGEPLRPLEQRRAKFSALKDVAGMLRSFNYAAVAALFTRAEPESEAWTRLEPWARCWEQLARERFLSGYLTRAHEGRFLPADRDDLTVLLDAFEIEKTLYELTYERGHRPDWVRIPLHGLARILEAGT
jgi:maltose alpha-D-glucosyltransferase/alpha-amylase